MKITLSKTAGAAGASNRPRPDRIGLWGKKPDAKIAMARGVKALARRIAQLDFMVMMIDPTAWQPSCRPSVDRLGELSGMECVCVPGRCLRCHGGSSLYDTAYSISSSDPDIGDYFSGLQRYIRQRDKKKETGSRDTEDGQYCAAVC